MSKVIKWTKRVGLVLVGLTVAVMSVVYFSIPSDDSASLPMTQPSYIGKMVITNINVVNVNSGTIIESQDVFISHGKIIAMVLSGEKPVLGFEVIDGNNLYLSPGLIDSHVYLFEPQALSRFLASGVTTVRNMQGMPIHFRWKEAQKNGLLTGATLITAGPTLNGNSDAGPFHQVVETPAAAEKLVTEYKQRGFDLI